MEKYRVAEVEKIRKIYAWSVGLAAVALSAVVTSPANAVVGGTTASNAGPNVGVEAPGAVCSGTILNRRWVMSASHCFAKGTIGTIQWGNVTRGKGQRARFSRVEKQDDLALIRLDAELPVAAVEFPSLGIADPPVGSIVQFSGFGIDDSGNISPVLRTGSALVVTPWNNGRGDVAGGPSWTIRKNGNGVPAPGDSGSGSYFGGKLVGVNSNADADGANCASVAAHRSFIDSTIRVQ